jgi:hypothetical protein
MEVATSPSPAETSPDAPEGDGAVCDQGNAPESTPEEGERDESGRYVSREAASYRRRLRETEAERDRLREQLDRVQRAEVERLASGAGLAVASDVWLHGATPQTLCREDGTVDPDTVTGVVEAILRDRPGLQAVPVGSVGIGKGGTASGRPVRQAVGLSQLLKP